MLDPSVILQAKAPQSNLLQTAEQLQGLQNAANQNRMFQSEQAGGAALLQGGGDPAATRAALIADPRTAYAAPGIMTAALAQQGAQLNNTASQVANMRKVAGTVPPNADGTPNTVGTLAALHAGAQAGLFTPDQVATLAGDGDKLGAFIKSSAISGEAGPNAMAAQGMGPIDQINTGGNIQSVQANPVLGTISPANGAASNIPTTETPAEKLARVSGVNPNTGEPFSVPQAAITTPTGSPVAVPGVTGANGEIQTGLAPGVAEGIGARPAASGAQYAADLADSPRQQTMTAQLKTLGSLLQSPEGKTGPGTQVINGWRNFVLGNMPELAKIYPGLTEAQIQSSTQDQIKKYMSQIALQQSGAFGPSTNEKLAAAASGNANVDMSDPGNLAVNRMNLALTRAQQARLAQFQQSGLPDTQYSTWASNWNRHVDPRAFMLDSLSAPERSRLLGEIKTPADQAAFLRGKAAAEQTGLFQDSDIPK